MFNIAIQTDYHEITTVVRVDVINHLLLPREDSRYEWSDLDVDLYDVNIDCTGLQTDRDDTFPVNLYFTGTIISAVLEEIRECYEIGKLIKVKGSFHVSHDNDNWSVMLHDPVASYLPKVAVEFYEKTMEEGYLPQRTLETLYKVPGEHEK